MYQKQPSIDKFAFRYLYDETNRCIEKQLPGCEKIVYAYDAADRVVMSQTGNQRRTGHKTFYRYDALGRNTHVVERAVGNDSLVTIRKFYDDYSFLDQQGFNSPCFKVSAQRAQGLLTGREVAVYGCDSLLREVNLYDRKGRLTRQIRTNMRGGYDDTSYKYSFTDKPVSKLMVHSTANMPTLTQHYEYEYDHADRLAKVTYSLNNAEKKTLHEIDYDELGRVHDERTGDMAELARTIIYNIRSWPIVRYGPLLKEKICYEEGYSAHVECVTPCYNGNISAYVSSIGKPAKGRFEEINNIRRCFRFNYDGLSRLKKAEYVENDKANNYYDTSYEYDLQGNLTRLYRNAQFHYSIFGPVDWLIMEYKGNQLCKVSDRYDFASFSKGFHFVDGSNQAEEYAYDANGNMTSDLNKHISLISYNTLNLPSEVRFADGSSIAYLYDADGNKLRTSYAIASYSESMPVTQVMHGNVSSQAQQPYMARNSIDYCGSAVYENGKLAYVPIDVGYITFADSTATSAPTFHYYVKDYLGNNRLVVRDDGFGEQMNHYYPFGALMSASTQGAAQRYKYNGKELDRIHGLNLYDYGARQYDAALGRWTSIDPLAEKYYGVSPYAYCANNPVTFVDPDGRNPIYNSKGIFLGTSSEGFTGQIYIYTGIEQLDFSNHDMAYWTGMSENPAGYELDFKTYDEVERAYEGDALMNFELNVLNHLISHFNGVEVFEKTFNMSDLKGGKIGFTFKENSNFTTWPEHDGIKAQIDAHQNVTRNYEGTVENFAATIIIHEWYSHGKYKIGDAFGNHYKAYENVKRDRLFYPKTTENYKKMIENRIEYYKSKKK